MSWDRSAWGGGRDNPFGTLRRVVKKAKNKERVNSRDCEEAATALSSIELEKELTRWRG
jgi:hypothetical protein